MEFELDFEYTTSFYVEPNDLREMYLLCKNEGYTPQEALNEVASGWDYEDFYTVRFVEDQIIEEINRRLSQTNYNKEKREKADDIKKIPNGCKGCCYWSTMNNKCISEEQKEKGSLKKGLCE